MVDSDWLPTSENINALPLPLRRYIMELQTNADPAGIVRENAVLRHDNAEFELLLAASIAQPTDKENGHGPQSDASR